MLPTPKARGRKRSVDFRLILNAILYVLKGGISWRMLLHEFTPWKPGIEAVRQRDTACLKLDELFTQALERRSVHPVPTLPAGNGFCHPTF
jgi:transposase